MNNVAILLVIYNDLVHLPRLIASIYNQSYKLFDIYAIETSEKGDSIKLLKELYPKAKIFPYKGNLGFAAGNNFLAEKAFQNGADFLFVLNTDMELEEKCLEELVQLVESDSQIGGASPIVLHGRNNSKTNEIQCYAEKINFDTAITTPLINQSIFDYALPDKVDVNILHGGATFIRSELYKDIGLFNEDNFMYGDERDLAFRINQTAFRLCVTKKAICWHFHDRSFENKNGFHQEYYYRLRNRYLYFRNYRKYKSLFTELFKEIIKIPFVIRWTNKRDDRALLKYYYLGLLHGIQNKKGRSNINFDR